MKPSHYAAAHTAAMFAGRQDVLPALLHTLAPQIRPVVERLLQPNEHAALADVTDSMLAYGLRYAPPAPAPVFSQQNTGAAPATNLPLKPAVDRLCAYQVSLTWHLQKPTRSRKRVVLSTSQTPRQTCRLPCGEW